jgi:hypothetical protein
MLELIEDTFGEVDVEMLTVSANIAYHVGYRKVMTDPQQLFPTGEPYADWVWAARYAWEDD